MAKFTDVNGYYSRLGISPQATTEEIKRAFRRLAKEHHPDRHPNNPSATAQFQALNEAYATLVDDLARVDYDVRCKAEDPGEKTTDRIDPVKCSSCGKISAQPRYVIFGYVISLVLISYRRAFHGVFCPSCAAVKSIEASAISWLLGWWGFPWGPIWVVAILYRNLLGGNRPTDVNGEILARQAIYFWTRNEVDLARAAVNQALGLKTSAPLKERLANLRDALPVGSSASIVDRWRLLRGWAFWGQAAPIAAVICFGAWDNQAEILDTVSSRTAAHVEESRVALMSVPGTSGQILATLRPFENVTLLQGRNINEYERVVTGRGVVGYVARTAVADGDGMIALRNRCFPFGAVSFRSGYVFKQTAIGPHTLTVKNGLSSDAVVKLRDVADRTVLSFYVEARGEAMIETVPEGTFRIDFATGQEFSPACGYFLTGMASQRFVDPETFRTQFQGAYRYTSVLEISLNPVAGGTAHTVTTDDLAFDRD